MSGELENKATESENILKMLNEKKAPEVGNKPIYAKDLEYAKMAGAKSMKDILGQKLDDRDEKSTAIPLNFGSKASTGFMPEETRLRLFELKKLVSNVQIQANIKGRSVAPTVAVMESVPEFKQLKAALKAFNITDFSQWIDTVQARFFFEEYEVPLILADQFDYMPMTSPTVRVSGALGLLEGELETDDAIFTPQTNTQASYLVEAKNNVTHAVITQDLLDDSSPAIINKYRKEVLMGGSRAYERAVINGTAAGTTHIDADTEAGSAKLFTKAFDGLRKRAFDGEALVAGGFVYDNLGSAVSKDTYSELLKKLNIHGNDKSQVAYIMGTSVAHDLVTGAIPELFTAFAFGSLASNVTGQVPPVFGIQGIESNYIREDLAADGKAIAAPATTLTCMLAVRKSAYANWVRQATRIFASPSLPSSDTMLMTGKVRHAFAGTPVSAKEKNVAMAVNIKTV